MPLPHRDPGDSGLHRRQLGLTARSPFATGNRDHPRGDPTRFGRSLRRTFKQKFATHEKRTEYQTSIPQALALMNNPLVANATHPDKRKGEQPLPRRKRIPPCERWAERCLLQILPEVNDFSGDGAVTSGAWREVPNAQRKFSTIMMSVS